MNEELLQRLLEYLEKLETAAPEFLNMLVRGALVDAVPGLIVGVLLLGLTIWGACVIRSRLPKDDPDYMAILFVAAMCELGILIMSIIMIWDFVRILFAPEYFGMLKLLGSVGG